MAQGTTAVNENSDFCSVIQVDKDVSFVMENRNTNYTVVVPSDKNIGMSRKTYSKKYPITFSPCVSFAEDSANISSSTKNKKQPLKSSPKCTSAGLNIKGILKKRLPPPEFSSSNSVPKKVRKNASSTKVQPPRLNGRITYKFKVKCPKSSEKAFESSPGIDINILEVTNSEQNSLKSKADLMKKSTIDSVSKEGSREKSNEISKKKNNAKSLTSILKPCFPSNDDVPVITEGDTAPIIPPNPHIPGSSAGVSSCDIVNASSMKWLSANGTIKISSLQNGEACSAKESEMKLDDNFCSPEMKASQGKKSDCSRELKGLYRNLNEIKWAHEKNFKQMLINTDDEHRHSARITAKISDMQKNLRRLKSSSGNKSILNSDKQKEALAKNKSAKLVLQRAKYGKLKKKVIAKPVPKRKVPLKKVVKKVIQKHIKPNKKLSKAGVKDNSIKSKMGSTAKIITSAKTKKSLNANSNKTSKIVNNSVSKKVGNCSKTVNNSVSKRGSIKKGVLPNEDANKIVKSSSSSILKKFDEVEVANEIEILRNYFHGDDNAFTALQKGSKLRVTVKPLEHTKWWNTEFFEAFKKHVLEQALHQTFEKKDQESINAMFQELQDSCFNPPSTIKTQKKKKHEEEGLRTSVRQSEGAFRYKEIVVKKHENYMQFVLVPNSSKRNSLTIEAMKELKDAFLLAKKDSNCRAVLLNSSGTYFCTGIDLSLLVGANKKQVAEEMATTIKDLVVTLSTFTKPVIAAVNGTAVGFGVSLLTYCDVVLASDKATFCVPATRLGYIPEGAITLTLPQVVGSGVATEMLLYGRRLTAEQALQHGLVSEVLWPTQLMNEVVPRIQNIVSQSLQVMEATKTMVRCHLWDKLKAHIEREWRLLPTLWLEAECQHNIKRTLQTGWLLD